ncbi:MAG: SDR family NAD(P)-dependent oxidoreductase, partial [Cyanobacteria bacterium P01_F01_bin.150]
MTHTSDTIAIIGTACRLPGACNLNEFWHLLSTGQDQISTLSAERWALARPHLSAQEIESVRKQSPICWGGFLDHVDQFDPSFFGISAREAVSMSPQHRLLLEIAWEALEDAALRPDQLNKTKTGVFLGLTNRDYSHLAWNHHDLEDPYLTTGNSSSIAASRISYLLNLLGPCVVVDTACSSSLVALHLACQSIRSGESTMAFAGGVNLTLDPDLMLNLAAGGFQAPDGRCKTFDSRADGYVRGEGAGIVLLKSLDRALADGDPIHGLILGSAVNQDGRTQGITAPKPTAQEAVVRQAYQQAGVSPSQVQYVETHGTGTKLGDPIELAALGKVLKEGRNPEERCLVGAVKTNIGHLEAAAGIAGLIKAVLSLQHRQIPPNLHFQSPNPYINFDRLPVEVPQTLTPWPSYGEEAIASVSAFSFGGTNAHVVLQAASERPQPVIQIERPQHLLTLSAKSLTALKDMAQRYQNHVQQTEQTLGDICHTANVGRVHHDYRLAIASTSKTDLVEKLKAFGLGEDNPSVIQGQRSPHTPSNIAFLFTGQGSQYVDMGRELYETQPTFRNALDQCAEILSRVNVPLLEIMYGEAEGGRRKAEGRRQKAEGRRQKAKRSQELGINTTNNEQSIHQTAYTQPVLFALEYALYQLWQSWGIKPSIVMGHSVGEYVAACVAGVFSLEDGLKLIAARGRLMQQLPIGGTMVSVMASAGQVRGIIAKRENGARDNIAIAAINGPESTVISGEESAIQAIAQQFETRGIKTKRLSVSHGFHSPLMEPMVAEFEQVAREISYSQPKLKLISNVTGQIVTDKVATPDYWCEHILAPVNFAAGMESLLQEEINIFLECGPQPTLLGMGRQCLPEAEEKIWLPSLRSGQDDWQQILTSLSEIYAHGGKIDWLSFDKDYPQRRRVSLPTYPFQRQRYWIDGAERHRRLGQTVHPLLGVKTELAGGETLYSQQFDPQKGWLADHQVHNTLTMPGAGFAALALASQQGPTQLHNVIFERLMLVSEPCELQFCLDTLDDSKQRRFTIYSRQRSQDETWQLHSYGHIGPASLSSECIDLERLQSRLHSRSVPQMYQQMEAMGLKFGPAFQGMQQLWGGEAEALAELMLPDTLTTAQQIEPIHPALLDACCQTLFGATDEHLDTVLYLPIQYRQIELYRSAPSHLFCYAQRVEIDTNAQTITSNLTFIDEHGEVFGRLQGFVLKRTARNALLQERTQSATHLLYETQWQSIDIHQAVEPETTTGQWLILGETDICTMLSEQLVAHGQSALWGSPHQLATLLDKGAALENGERGHDSTLAGIVLISSANADDIIAETGLNADTVLQVIQTLLAQQIQLAHGITLITQKGVVVDVADDVSPSQAALWGLGRSLQTEQPQLGVRLIDIEQIDIDCIASKYLSEVLLSQSESQVALRDNQTFIPRLVSAGQSRQLIRPIADDVALSFSQRGSLDHLTLIPHTLPTPGKGEVQLTVRAAGLNFRDVLNVLGAYPGDAGELGGEVAGIVTAVGDEVSHLTVGEPVYGFSTGSFATRCNTSAALLQKLPTAIPFAAAATIPITFCTAQEAIARLDLKAGDKILIHAAAGGVGLAAVQLAQAIGAEVYATASTGKHAYLKQLGINHIYDSRTIDFGEQIRRDTDGLGLDAVLNSLTSEGFIDATLTALAEGGRFVEIGKRDIWSAEQMAQVRADVDYHVLALDEMVVRSPHHIQHLLSDLTPRFVSGELQPLTRRLYSLSEAPTAMRFMQQARHIGKLVFTMEETAIRPDASYLITGGLGSLGLQTCEWLLAQGAQHVVLSSRRTPNEMTKQQIDTLKQSYNSVIEVHIADVTNAEQVHELIGLFGQDWPGLAGVIHAAGVLDDGVISEQTPERFARVLAPKIHGAWHLHQATRHHNLDCFVLYSSVAATLGAAGQSSYATANAFLDGLAQHRRAQGLCATSINWGPWAEGGMAMDATVRANLAKQGLTPLQAKDAHQAVAHLLAAGTPTGVVLDADWQRMGRYLGEVRPALLSQLLSQPSPTTEKGLLQQLRSAALADRLSLLMRYLQQDLQRILGFAQLPDPDVSVFDLGMDSLMAVELRNRLQQQLGNTYTVPNTLAFDYPTIRRLATHLAEQLGELPKSQPQPTQAVSRSLDGDAVAIVGLACRFPGAPDKDAYWQLLTNGVDAISEVPPDRWDINAYYDPDPDAPGKMTTRYGGFIPDIDQFDAGFFGIAPREAIELDPQQRLLLEISWQALEDANIAPASLVGSQTGVYVGLSTSDYSQLIARGGEQTIGQYMGTGTAASAAVGRLSYVLGLEGPSLAIDTACSSSLVALHQAARGLLNGDCQLALVGGVNAILSPETTIYFSKGRFMAPDGRCKTFDALADGYVRGEGCGMVVLKRLSEAERDGDRIYSIIRGSAVNQDGASGGLTVPNGPAQQRVIKQALAEANIKPEEVTYVEA